tara:strand:+ start:1191 stop:1529 length:339 start_codon:yes stop_codon:yes gene_type:complete
MSNWKEISKTVSELHSRLGLSVVDKEGSPITEGNLINLTNEDAVFTKKGDSLKPKEIRKWLWSYRKNRSFSRKNLVVWSSYDEANETSHMGVGAIVAERVSAKFPSDKKVEI